MLSFFVLTFFKGGEPEALWQEGGHLVNWHHGAGDERRRASLFTGKNQTLRFEILLQISNLKFEILGEANASSVADSPGRET